MSTLTIKNNISLVNLILPKDSLSSAVSELQKAGALGVFHIAARGSIINEGGLLSKMFPPPSPEQCLVQFLVPDSEKQRITDIAWCNERWVYDLVWHYLEVANKNSNWNFPNQV